MRAGVGGHLAPRRARLHEIAARLRSCMVTSYTAFLSSVAIRPRSLTKATAGEG